MLRIHCKIALCFLISLFDLSAILKIRNGEHAHYVRLVVAYTWNRAKQMFVALGKEFDMFLFSEAALYFLLALLFARNSPFYLCPLLFSFVFLSPYSAYFGVLCNFLARFSGLALRRLLVAFFGRSVSLYPAYFQLKPSLHELEL